MSHLPQVYSQQEHGIIHDQIHPHVLHIIFHLQQEGFIAYLVGGSVRDLLLGHVPKDFDVSTSAEPKEIKALFGRSCLIIGRRFQLAHIRHQNTIFEVSTFRQQGNNDDDALIQRDNFWGTPEEDAQRRDFTINSLFYDPHTEEILDFVGGWEDIQKRQLTVIGDPVIRFKQDPVRMIRLLKFHARFSFQIEPSIFPAFEMCRQEITGSSPARIVEELFKMLHSRHNQQFLRLMISWKLLPFLLPQLSDFLASDSRESVYLYLEAANTLQEKQPLDRALLAACLLFPVIEKTVNDKFLSQQQKPHLGQLFDTILSLVHRVLYCDFLSFPKKIRSSLCIILEAQYRLTPLFARPYRYRKIMYKRSFPLALQFLYIRSLVYQRYRPIYQNWYDWYQESIKQQRSSSKIAFEKQKQKNSAS